MPTAGSITKTVRINPTDLVVVEGLMKDGTSWSGAIHKLCENYTGTPAVSTENCEGTPNEYEKKYADLLKRYDDLSEELRAKTGCTSKYELSEEVLDDIGSMTTLSDMSVETAIEEFDRLLNEGALVIGDEINVELPSWTKRITDVCHDRCISVESMGKKIVEMIERGQI